MAHEDNLDYSDSEARVSFGSLILLVIFVSAAALIMAAVIWRPWFGDSGAQVNTVPTGAVEQQLVVADGAPTASGGPQGP